MSAHSTIVSLTARDIRFPTSRWLDGSDAMHTDPDYSAAYVVLRTELGRRARGPRPHVHERTRHRGLRRRDPRARAAGRRAHARGHLRRHARVLAEPRLRHPAPLARPREGRHPPRDRRGRERRLGPVGEARGQAPLEAPVGHDAPSSSSRASTSATSRTPSRPRRRSTCCASARRGAAERERADRRLGLSRRTRRRRAGSATATTRSRPSSREARRRRLHPREDEGRRRPRVGRSARGD